MIFKKNKNIIVAGCSHFGSSIAGALSEKEYEITIIDKSEDSFRKLPESFTGFQIKGDATNIDILEKAGIIDADMLIASTNSDNTNSLIAQIAKKIYNTNKVIIRLKDSERNTLITNLNINIICPSELCINEFKEINSSYF